MSRLSSFILLSALAAGALTFSAAAAQADACPDRPTRLWTGMEGRVTPGDPNRLRETPSTAAAQVGALDPGATFSVLGGPECSGGYRWWQVEAGDQSGWTAEGDANGYFVEPLLPQVAPIMRWGSGTPRDVVWTDDYIAVAGSGGVFIFDAAQPDAAPRALEPLDNWPSQLAADPSNSNRLAVLTGSRVTFWDVAAGEPTLSWTNGGASQVDPAFSDDGARFLTANGFQAFVWDAQTGDLLTTFGDEARPVNSAALSPDGRQVLTSASDGSLRLWDAETGTLLRGQFDLSPDIVREAVGAVAFTPDGRAVASADRSGHIRVWPLDDPGAVIEYEREYRGDPATPGVSDLRFIDAHTFVTAETSATGGVRLWRLDDAITQVAEIDPYGFALASQVAVSPDATQVAAVMRYQDGYGVEIIDLESFEIVQTVGDFRDVNRFTLSQDGTRLVTDGLGPRPYYDTADGEVIAELQLNGGEYVTGSAISPDNNLITACVAEGAISYDPVILGWSLMESREPFTLLEEFAFTSGGICKQTFIGPNTLGFFSDDGVYAGPRFGGDYAQLIARAQTGPYGPYDGAFGPLGVLGRRDQGFTIFDLDDPAGDNIVVELPWAQNFESRSVVSPFALYADGTRLVRRGEAAPEDIDFYDINGTRAVRRVTLSGAAPVSALAFSADGRFVASGQSDGSVILWDIASEFPVLQLTGSFGLVTTLAFSPDGSRLYGSGQDNVVKVWSLDALA